MLISRKPQAAQMSSRARPIALRHAGSLALLVLVAFLVVSCSGSGTPSQDVAPGTYQLTVTVASGTDTHTLPLTLIVTK
jgi:PBP1b-binding outer membrane lipoprotein LpoB